MSQLVRFTQQQRLNEFQGTPVSRPVGGLLAPAGEAPPPTVPAIITPFRRRLITGRRGELFASPITAVEVPAAPEWAARIVRARTPQRLLARRGEFLPITVSARPPPASLSGIRRHPVTARPGTFLPIPLVGAALPAPPAYSPAFLEQTHTRPVAIRRGRVWQIPLVGEAPAAPPAVVPWLITHRPPPVTRRRRGRLYPAPSALVAVLPLLVGRRARSTPQRSRFLALPCAVPPVPLRITAQRRRVRPSARRGRVFPLYLLGQDVPPPPLSTWVPNLLIRRRTRPAQQRSRRSDRAWCVCITNRPGTGTTARPNTGITTYALASTLRPNTGTTLRPNTGTTADPCC